VDRARENAGALVTMHGTLVFLTVAHKKPIVHPVGGVNAPGEYGSSGGRALRMVCRPSSYWEA
jgi:hypothetical protein